MKSLEYFWKLDSLGSNGFRHCASGNLISSDFEALDLDYVLEHLGKPNEFNKFRNEYELIYYTFDPRKIAGMLHPPSVYYFIFLKFNPDTKKLVKIDSWFGDL